MHSFVGGADGENPTGELTEDGSGNLYGVAPAGGLACIHSGIGCGVIFKVDQSGNEMVLYRFTGGQDGYAASGTLVRDASGALFGAAPLGGLSGGCGGGGCGVIFKLDANNRETVVYAFQGGADGGQPSSGLIADPQGNLYGVTGEGGNFGSGCEPTGCGVVFKVSRVGTETVLHRFVYPNLGSPDGRVPVGDLFRSPDGSIYGTTEAGGPEDWGVIFKLIPGGQETILHAFTGGADGATPQGGLIMDSKGNLYGTALQGGTGCGLNCGVLFKLDSAGRFAVLHNFNGADGAYPYAGLTRDSAGNLYGTTSQGGVAYGVVFELTP